MCSYLCAEVKVKVPRFKMIRYFIAFDCAMSPCCTRDTSCESSTGYAGIVCVPCRQLRVSSTECDISRGYRRGLNRRRLQPSLPSRCRAFPMIACAVSCPSMSGAATVRICVGERHLALGRELGGDRGVLLTRCVRHRCWTTLSFRRVSSTRSKE